MMDNTQRESRMANERRTASDMREDLGGAPCSGDVASFSLHEIRAQDLPAHAILAVSLLHDAGFEAYLVGGIVRDALLGKPAHDADVATSATWEEVRDVFSARGYSVLETGTRHGTVTVLLGEGGQNPVEITTFRVDGAYSDGRHPDEVRFVRNIGDDLARRDFTINAMAWSQESGLIDLFGGREDLAHGIIRAVGDPEKRFSEDGLRVLRALRFASRLKFRIEPATREAVLKCAPELRGVSEERIGAEYDGLIAGDGAVEVLREYASVIGTVIPEIVPMFGFEQHSRWHIYDVWEHCLHTLKALDPDASLLLRHVALLHDIGKPESFTLDESGNGHFFGHERAGAIDARSVFRRLRWRSLDIDHACTLIKYHDRHIEPNRRGVTRMLARLGRSYAGADEIATELFRELLTLKRADINAHAPATVEARLVQVDEVERAFEQTMKENCVFRVRDLAISGRDVIACGVSRGPQVGFILRELLDRVIDGSLENSREALLGEAHKLAEQTA
jgi:tRNA nucleotidyltransferase (CCA-adding enzyme)